MTSDCASWTSRKRSCCTCGSLHTGGMRSVGVTSHLFDRRVRGARVAGAAGQHREPTVAADAPGVQPAARAGEADLALAARQRQAEVAPEGQRGGLAVPRPRRRAAAGRRAGRPPRSHDCAAPRSAGAASRPRPRERAASPLDEVRSQQQEHLVLGGDAAAQRAGVAHAVAPGAGAAVARRVARRPRWCRCRRRRRCRRCSRSASTHGPPTDPGTPIGVGGEVDLRFTSPGSTKPLS